MARRAKRKRVKKKVEDVIGDDFVGGATEPPVINKPMPDPPEANPEIELRPMTIGRPQRKPTDQQIVNYMKFVLGQIRVHLRSDIFKDVEEIKVCLKIKKRF